MNKIFLPLLPALLSSVAIADDAVETIEVTALRTPTLAENLASPITVVTASELAQRQTFQISDILKGVPGVALASAGSVGGQQQLRLRGAEANHTLILIDGVEVNDPAAGDEFQFEHLVATEIERIEVIRGPMSAQWGTDAVTGVINIITKKGNGDTKFGASVEYGAFDTRRGSVSLSGGDEALYYALGMGLSKSDGTNASRTGDEADGYRNFTFNGKIGGTVSEYVDYVLTARHSDARNEFDGIDFVSTGLPADSDNVTHNENTNLGLTITADLFGGKLTEQVRVTYLETELRNLENGAPDGSTAAEKVSFYWDNRIALAEGHTLTLALDHESTDFSQRGVASFFGDPNQDQELSVTGLTADYLGIFGDLALSASLRHDDNSDFDNNTSWRTGLAYKLGTGRVFANVSKGQKAPTFIERFGFFSDQFVGNPDLQPESVTNYEIGFEQRIGAVTVGATAYTSRLTDEINGFAFDPDTFLFTAENRDGRSKRDGVELTATAVLSKTATLRASYAYVDAEEQDATGTFVRELRRPRHSGNANLGWQATDALHVNVDVIYTGAADDMFFPPFPQPSERVTLQSYILADVAVTYALRDGIDLYARGENLLGEDYEDVFGFETPGTALYAGLKITY